MSATNSVDKFCEYSIAEYDASFFSEMIIYISVNNSIG